jgi:predicted nucleic acid-binding Zn ribbon protein
MAEANGERSCSVCGRPIGKRKGKVFCGPKCKQKQFRTLRTAVMTWVESVIARHLGSSPLVAGHSPTDGANFPEE